MREIKSNKIPSGAEVQGNSALSEVAVSNLGRKGLQESVSADVALTNLARKFEGIMKANSNAVAAVGQAPSAAHYLGLVA